MTRKVLTPWRGEGSGVDRRERRPAERLARYYAAWYVETPEYESRLALVVLMSWFNERTAEWMADECVRASMAMNALEAGISTVLGVSIPRRAHMGLESASPCRHPKHPRPRWTYTTNVLPKDSRRWYAMGATDSTWSLPTAVTHAGMRMRKMAGRTNQQIPRRGRMIRPTPSGDEDA
jgi:hypothetical protein